MFKPSMLLCNTCFYSQKVWLVSLSCYFRSPMWFQGWLMQRLKASVDFIASSMLWLTLDTYTRRWSPRKKGGAYCWRPGYELTSFSIKKTTDTSGFIIDRTGRICCLCLNIVFLWSLTVIQRRCCTKGVWGSPAGMSRVRSGKRGTFSWEESTKWKYTTV